MTRLDPAGNDDTIVGDEASIYRDAKKLYVSNIDLREKDLSRYKR
ncbi:unnamed protein product [uncultured virus]|nr:unnamed protein product [uncultured virus]